MNRIKKLHTFEYVYYSITFKSEKGLELTIGID